VPRARRYRLGSAALGLALLGACGTGGSDEGACGPIVREALDSAYLVHVLGDERDVEYTSDPPTSGPHQPGPPVEGVVEDPISRPVQVGILERGDVLLQHDPDLPEAELGRLAQLAGDGVVVAPNPELSDAVVATAWTAKRTCSGVDTAALEEFVDERAGKGPEG